eukprot:191155-Amphidinium_carterae.3
MVSELCGGTATVSAELADKGHACGTNFDLTTDKKFDLATRMGRRLTQQRLEEEQPWCVVAAPPCTYFAGFSKINSLHNPSRYRHERNKSIRVADLVAEVCAHQVKANRFFIIENPQRSDLWRLPSMIRLSEMRDVNYTVVDQCMYGLCDEHGQKILKATTFLTNLPAAAERLSTRCSRNHEHRRLEGGEIVARAQVWPHSLAEAIAMSVLDSVSKQDTGKSRHHAHFSGVFPARYVAATTLAQGVDNTTLANSRRYAPRARQDRTSGARGAHREPPRQAPPQDQAPPDEPAAGSLTQPGEADAAQEEELATIEPPHRPSIEGGSSSSETLAEASTDAVEPNRRDVEGTHRHRLSTREAETQAINAAQALDQSAYDLSRVADTLCRPGQPLSTIRAIIRRLHHRWWHCSKEKMHNILKASGQPDNVLKEIDHVISSCPICRAWKSTPHRSQSTAQIPLHFNDRVQCDLLWLDSVPTLHLIDEATKYSQARFLENVSEETIMDNISDLWVRIFGAMKVLVCDQEGGLRGDHPGVVLNRWGTQSVLLPEGAHGAIVERHHAVIRNTYHKLRDQVRQDGLAISPQMLLNETIHSHNVLTSVSGHSPHQAVLGCPPPVLRIDDSPEALEEGRLDIHQQQKVREHAVCAMVKTLAEDRIRRAMKSKTQRAAVEHRFKLHDLVDFYRTPVGKSNPGWRGPAHIVDLTSLESDGIIHVKWQGRVLSARAGDVRPHLVLPVFLLRASPGYADLFDYLDNLFQSTQLFAELPLKTVFEGKTISTPRLSHHASLAPTIYDQLQHLAKYELGISASTFVLGSGVRKYHLPSHIGEHLEQGTLLYWVGEKVNSIFEHEVEVHNTLNLKELIGKNWEHARFIIVLRKSRSWSSAHRNDEEDDYTQPIEPNGYSVKTDF